VQSVPSLSSSVHVFKSSENWNNSTSLGPRFEENDSSSGVDEDGGYGRFHSLYPSYLFVHTNWFSSQIILKFGVKEFGNEPIAPNDTLNDSDYSQNGSFFGLAYNPSFELPAKAGRLKALAGIDEEMADGKYQSFTRTLLAISYDKLIPFENLSSEMQTVVYT